MRRFVKMRDPLVYPIDRDRILNEIVRADAEKIDFARERRSAEMAALGISIIAPTSALSIERLPSRCAIPLCTRSRICRARRNSSSPEIIGNMIFTFPTALARKIARNCALKISGFSRQKRMARSAEKWIQFIGDYRRRPASLSPPRSKVRMISGCGRTLLALPCR